MMVVAETLSQFEYDRYRDIADEGGADQNRPFEKVIVERSREPCGDDEQRQACLIINAGSQKPGFIFVDQWAEDRACQYCGDRAQQRTDSPKQDFPPGTA